MNVLAVLYHAHPILWTIAMVGIAYAYGKGDTDRTLDHWREMHEKTFRCKARTPDDR